MATKKDAKEELVKFIDKKAFNVIIKTSPDKFEGKDRKTFEELNAKQKTRNKNFIIIKPQRT